MKKGLVSILSAVMGVAAGVIFAGKINWKELDSKQRMADKHLQLFLMMNQWLKVKQEEKNLAIYFKENGYRQIAIYGMHYAGEALVNELEESGIEVKYGIDKNAENVIANFDIVKPEDILEEVDVIVVTAISFYNEIKEFLQKKVNCPIVSLEEIVYQL